MKCKGSGGSTRGSRGVIIREDVRGAGKRKVNDFFLSKFVNYFEKNYEVNQQLH